jgi:hypothetical protein
METENWQVAVQMVANPLIGAKAAELKTRVLEKVERLRKAEALLVSLSEELEGAASRTEKPSAITDR